MVVEIKKDNKTYFKCENCSFVYEKKELAEKCEEFCNKNGMCNSDLAKQAVKI